MRPSFTSLFQIHCCWVSDESVLTFESRSALGEKERKEKERKSIYIAPFRTKVHTKRSVMDHTVLPANNTMPACHGQVSSFWLTVSNGRFFLRHALHTLNKDKLQAAYLLRRMLCPLLICRSCCTVETMMGGQIGKAHVSHAGHLLCSSIETR